jgi:hypothetical protein
MYRSVVVTGLTAPRPSRNATAMYTHTLYRSPRPASTKTFSESAQHRRHSKASASIWHSGHAGHCRLRIFTLAANWSDMPRAHTHAHQCMTSTSRPMMRASRKADA